MNHQSHWTADSNKNIVCPHCQHEYSTDSSDYFWHDYVKNEDDDDQYQRQLECTECEKLFDVTVDRHNVSDGYSCSIPDCESVKLKHKMVFTKEHKSKEHAGVLDYHIYECSKCEKRDFVPVDSKGKKLSPLKEALLRRQLSKAATIIDGKTKTGDYFLSTSEYFFECSVHINAKEESGNLQIVDSLVSLMKSMGFKVNKPEVNKLYDFVDVSPKGQYKNFSFEVRNYPAGLDMKVKVNKNRDTEKLTYLETKFLNLILVKSEKIINVQYPLITKRVKEEMGHWNRPNLDYVESHKEKVNLLRKHIDKNPSEGYNNKDKNKVVLKNGDIRYFYNYKNKLSRGEVHHHINNMWWVISGDTIYNIANFDLFEYEPNMSIKKPVDKVARLKAELKKYIDLEDFERCIKIKKQLKALL